MTQDLISLLYVGKNLDPDYLELFSKDKGFAAGICPDLDREENIPAGAPDIVLVDSLAGRDPLADPPPDPENGLVDRAKQDIARIQDMDFRFRPAVFLVLDRLPGSGMRRTLMEEGYDGFFIRPFTAGEVRRAAGIFLKTRSLEQKLYTLEKTQEKTFAYLDRFKDELKGLKEELIQEKTSLNHALKQIQDLNSERSQMKHQVSSFKQDLHQNMEGVNSLLYTLIKRRVETNRNHGERVAHVACYIGGELGFDEKKLEDLRKAGMLHELGLLFMADPDVRGGLDKDRLSAYEKDILVQYPVKGAELISRCSAFENAARIIRFMNENADGTGYPDGLKKRYIPLASRILAGADLFDRLKDEAGSLEDLLRALEKVSGSRLDPVIVGWLEKYAVLHMGADAYRVRGVGVEQLEPGMRLGTALFTATGTKLFPVDTLLDRESIDKIIKYNREYPVDETIYVKV
ncbi:HD domain-containing phosphohydrolase [Desulfospira joergensenii]|uniref:HD domain-containing phosphohydrolase n=1 Tax=Desulfospira joergensenii TaxID=53329 RepID=UPI00129469EF|nr:HD domain-containing phosphohydrolase [Desulfospira joergensenii]